MLKQFVDLPGVSNSRELGGYRIGDKTIRENVLIRTGDLSKASLEAVRTLSERYKVQTVIDFRMSNEIKASPDPEIDGAKHVCLPVLELEDYVARLGDPSIAKQYMSSNLDTSSMFEIAYNLGLIGPEMYTMFVLGERGIRAYKGFFEELLIHDPDKGALLWHCADGKDRAGFAAVLLLTVLGADRELIFKDYLLTNEYNAAVLSKVREKYADKGIPSDKFDALMFTSGGVIERYLANAYDVIEKRYGSASDYIDEVIGLSGSDRNEICSKYLI